MVYARPRILVSSCLGFEDCDIRGQKHKSLLVDELKGFAELIPVCPEMAMGLGSPRESIRIVLKNDEPRLIQPTTGMDLTERIHTFSSRYAASAKALDGCIMKNRSPTCGIRDVKIYLGMEEDSPTKRGRGLFAGHIQESFPNVRIEDEGRLTNQRVRESFLTVIFTKAAFRAIKEDWDYESLLAYHECNRLLFLSYNKSRYEDMSKALVKFKHDAESLLFYYEQALNTCLARLPRITSHKAVLLEIFSYFSRELKQEEIEFFESRLKLFEEERLPLSAMLTLLKAYILRFSEESLLSQSYFAPYPESLMTLHDSKK